MRQNVLNLFVFFRLFSFPGLWLVPISLQFSDFLFTTCVKRFYSFIAKNNQKSEKVKDETE